MEDWYVGAYWGNRRESAADCAARLLEFLTSLGSASGELSRWFLKGWSRKQALNSPVPLSGEFLTELMLKGRHYTDASHQLTEDLGFSAAMWNGKEPGVSLRVGVGVFATGPGSSGNTVIMDIGRRVGDREALFDLGVAKRVMSAVAASWDPDWASWTTTDLRRSQREQQESLETNVGWLTYLSTPRAKLVDIPEAQPMGTGVLVVAADKAEDVDTRRVIGLHRTLRGALWPSPQ
jgi:hypothetical protein